MAISYPSTLPCPQVSDYRGTVDYLIGSVKFNRGNTRRRYKSNVRIEQYDISFVYTLEQLGLFQSWANKYGYDWHWLRMVTHYSGLVAGDKPIPHRVRITSDLAITALSEKYFRVRLSIELDPTSVPDNVIIPSGRWIIAQTPASPSPDWVISGWPPATDTTSAGTPINPAA